MKSEMRAINWIRSRQESRELSYWLSFVNYSSKDRSFNNRVYLIYLVIFFSVWWFMVLIWFAKAGAFLLTAFSPSQPVVFIVSLELAVLLIWFIVKFFQCLGRSPVSFSEEDAYLTCQMPLDPRKVVLRWLVMPWVKSLIPFLVLALVLGFSLAEINLAPGDRVGQYLLEYVRVGLRALLVIVPLHLVMFSLNWSAGVWFMSHQRKTKALFLPIAYFLIGALILCSGIFASYINEWPGVLQTVSTIITGPLRLGFGSGGLVGPLLARWLIAIFSLDFLFWISKRFSLSRAAQETGTQSKIRDLERYGFSGRAREIQNQRRLGIERKAGWLPGWQGAMAMPWKGMLQKFRTFEISTLYDLLLFFGSMMGFVFIPNLSGRIFLLLTWVLQGGRFLTERLRQDLTHWTIVKQLPIKPGKWISFDLLPAAGVLCLLSLLGLTAGSLVSGQAIWGEVLTLPGIIAAVAGISANEIFRNSRVNLLLNGQAPGVSELGVIVGTICAGIPVLIYMTVSGSAGIVIALVVSLTIGVLAISSALKAYRMIQ